MAYSPSYPYQYPPQPNASSPDGRRWVQGEIGALSYYVTDNNVVTLWDSTDSDIFYEKSTDAYGKPVLKKYRRTEIPLAANGGETKEEQADLRKEYEALKKRVAKLERRRYEHDRYDSEDQ